MHKRKLKESICYSKLQHNKVQCQTCQRLCELSKGQRSFCQARINSNGKLYALNYGILSSPPQIDPIEKKPMYHLYPGTYVASIGTLGCNFRCKQCLNWSYTRQISIEEYKDLAKDRIEAEDLVKRVTKLRKEDPKVQGIAFTYNEPTIWLEYVYDCSKLAKENDLYTVFVTNGYITTKALDLIGPYMDGYAVDFKGFSDESYRKQGACLKFGKIAENTKRAKVKWEMIVEITTLVIPTINDDEKEIKEMVEWIAENLGKETPWHLSQFSPSLSPDKDFQSLPTTPVAQIKKFAEMGREAGLKHVYIWATDNFPQPFYQEGETTCPKCGEIVVRRTALSAPEIHLSKKGECEFCRERLNFRI